MATSKAKLKSIRDKASHCFKAFLIGNMSDKFLPTRTLLYISVRHIFISLTSFIGVPNSIIILYKASLLPESQAFSKSVKSWCTASLYSHFFSSIGRMQNIWSVVDLLPRNTRWWFPIMNYTYVLSPFRAVNTFRLGYKNQSLNVV